MLITRWVLPIAMMAIGIAVLAGWMLPDLPRGTALRPMIGLVALLLGLHRFVSARTTETREDRRRFGGGRRRPWE